MKFGRNYKLDIFTPFGKQITIEPPFSIVFSLTRNLLADANRGNVSIYNLSRSKRGQIYKDRFDLSTKWKIELAAGYGNNLYTIFKGNIYEAYSHKSKTEWITNIDLYDGIDAIQNGFTAKTIEKDTPKQNIVEKVINDMGGLVKGALGLPAQGEGSPRGRVLVGQSYDILKEETNNKVFIDLERVNILDDNEVIAGRVVKLDPSNLLETPRRRESFLDVKTLFEPEISVGGVYEIESLESQYNGQYKVLGFSHNVTISGASCGNATTDIQLDFIPKLVEVGLWNNQ